MCAIESIVRVARYMFEAPHADSRARRYAEAQAKREELAASNAELRRKLAAHYAARREEGAAAAAAAAEDAAEAAAASAGPGGDLEQRYYNCLRQAGIAPLPEALCRGPGRGTLSLLGREGRDSAPAGQGLAASEEGCSPKCPRSLPQESERKREGERQRESEVEA